MKKKLHDLLNWSIEKTYFNKTNQIYLVSILLFFLFRNTINLYINNLLVEPIICKANSHWTNLIVIFILINFSLAFHVWATKKHYKSKWFHTIIIFLLFSYHTTYRFIVSDYWEYYFFSLPWLGNFVYLDIIFVISFLHARLIFLNYLWQKKNFKNPIENYSSFTIDSDFKQSGKIDRLSRKPAALKLVDEINKFNSTESFAFGIVGQWGSGKTYFLEMMLTEIEEKYGDVIVIRFNPWRGKGNRKVLENFFDSMKSELSIYSGEVANRIDKYLQKLFLLDKTGLLGMIQETISAELSVEKEFDLINKTIKQINKKIVVSIDDLDRLDKDEICEVLKLIRNNANFHNTIFLAAYDKEYVVNAIKKINDYKPELYLEKIFQVELNLPTIRQDVIKDRFIEILCSKFKMADFDIGKIVRSFFGNEPFDAWTLDSILDSESIQQSNKSYSNQDIFLEKIQSLRDVTRLCNSFVFRYSFVYAFVNFEDYLLLEILKLKHHDIYIEIKSKSFLISKFAKESNVIVLAIESELFENYISKKLLTLTEENTIKKLITKIFHEPTPLDKRSIVAVESFDIYFSDYLHGKISLLEFKECREKSISEFKDQVDIWIKEKKGSDLLEILYSIKDNDYFSQKDFENILSICFYLGDLSINYSISDLVERLNKNTLRSVIQNFYNDDDEKLIAFIVKELNKYKNSTSFIAILLGQLIRGHIYKDEIPILRLQYLQQYAIKNLTRRIGKIENKKENLTFDDISNVFLQYYACIDSIEEKSSVIKILKKANAILKEFAIKHPELYIEFQIRPLSSLPNDKIFTIEPFTKQIFESYDEFENFVVMQEPTLVVLEFKQFFRKFKNNNFNPIEFVKNTIEFLSDSTVIFKGSPDYPNLIGNVNSVEFEHPSFLDFNARFPELKEAKWIAHAYLVSKHEAQKGGNYLFQYSIDLIYNFKKIKSAKIIYLVDDYLSLSLNSRGLIRKEESFGQIQKEHYFTDTIKDGNNVFDITINNIVMDRPEIVGRDNPYGIIFKIVIEYQD